MSESNWSYSEFVKGQPTPAELAEASIEKAKEDGLIEDGHLVSEGGRLVRVKRPKGTFIRNVFHLNNLKKS